MTPPTASATSTETMPFRLLVDEAMKWTRLHFRAVYPAVAIPVAAAFGILTVVELRWMKDVTFAGGASVDMGDMMQGCVSLLAASLLTITLATLGNTVMLRSCVEAVLGRPVRWTESWRFVVLSSTLWTLFLAGLTVGAGFLMLVIPGLYFALMLSFVVPVVAAEGLSGSAALRRSWGLVKYNPQGRFLANTGVKVFALYIVAGVLAYLVNALIQLPLTILQGASVLRSVAESGRADPQALLGGSPWLRILTTVLGSFVQTAVSVYTSFGVVLLYFDARRRKEGMDLEAAIASRLGPSPGARPA